jgi:D-alanyl-D-alanine carboxypeptidase
VVLLQLEAEGKLSIHDKLGTWLPQYKAWRNVTIAQLLSMTSGIPSYDEQLAFAKTLESAPETAFTAERLVAYSAGRPLGPAAYHYSNTNYILAQMVIERVTHGSYFAQVNRRILKPLGMRETCFAPQSCATDTADQMPAGYFAQSGLPGLLDKPVPPLALSWAQGAGALVSSLADMTTWDRALYSGRMLPAAQQRELETLVSVTTGRPIPAVTLADPQGYGLGIAQRIDPVTGAVWAYMGGTLGFRVLHAYFPRTGMIIALAVNSVVDQNTLPDFVDTLYQTISAAN